MTIEEATEPIVTTKFKRRRCRQCRHTWETLATHKPRCPKCQATQDIMKRRRKLCLRCGYAWECASRRALVRCPSCGLTAEPKFLERPVRSCPRCKHQWHERENAHPKRPRCPACFLNLKTLTGRQGSYAKSR